MAGIGLTATLLLVGIGFALYVGSGGVYAPGFIALTQMGSIQAMLNAIISSLSGITLGAVAIVSVASLTSGQSLKYTLAVAAVAAMSSFFLLPFTMVSNLGVPTVIQMLITTFFNILLVVAMLGFILEKEW